jgi:hypothetical protein
MDIQVTDYETGIHKTHHIPEIETIVGCSCCGHAFRARDTKCTMVRSQNTEKWIQIHNPLYVSSTKALVATEEGMQLVEQKPENPGVPKFIWRKVNLKSVNFTCIDCLNQPVYMSLVDRPSITPTAVLDIADEVRSLREEHGAKLTMLGHGRKIDTALEMVCQKLHVNYKEA